MDVQATAPSHTLLVTGPDRDRLYEHFARLFRGRADVSVLKDRRHGERRGARTPVAGERRTAERRRGSPAWVVPPA